MERYPYEFEQEVLDWGSHVLEREKTSWNMNYEENANEEQVPLTHLDPNRQLRERDRKREREREQDVYR